MTLALKMTEKYQRHGPSRRFRCVKGLVDDLAKEITESCDGRGEKSEYLGLYPFLPCKKCASCRRRDYALCPDLYEQKEQGEEDIINLQYLRNKLNRLNKKYSRARKKSKRQAKQSKLINDMRSEVGPLLNKIDEITKQFKRRYLEEEVGIKTNELLQGRELMWYENEYKDMRKLAEIYVMPPRSITKIEALLKELFKLKPKSKKEIIELVERVSNLCRKMQLLFDYSAINNYKLVERHFTQEYWDEEISFCNLLIRKINSSESEEMRNCKNSDSKPKNGFHRRHYTGPFADSHIYINISTI